MKTKEFKKKVEELGYTVEDTVYHYEIYNGILLCAIIDKLKNLVNFFPEGLVENSIINICVEYAKTPVEEREEDELAGEESIRIESFYNHIGERRYRIIRLETGEVHDGNGWGYKTVDSALKAYSYIRKYLS